MVLVTQNDGLHDVAIDLLAVLLAVSDVVREELLRVFYQTVTCIEKHPLPDACINVGYHSVHSGLGVPHLTNHSVNEWLHKAHWEKPVE